MKRNNKINNKILIKENKISFSYLEILSFNKISSEKLDIINDFLNDIRYNDFNHLDFDNLSKLKRINNKINLLIENISEKNKLIKHTLNYLLIDFYNFKNITEYKEEKYSDYHVYYDNEEFIITKLDENLEAINEDTYNKEDISSIEDINNILNKYFK